MPEILLSIDDLAVSAGGVRLLEGVTMRMRPDELVALTGPSGCGKTTLLRAIAGLDDPSSGQVRFNGTTPGEMGWPRFRRHVVFLHQRPVMLEAPVEENLGRPLKHKSVDKIFDRDHAADLLAEVGLTAGHLKQPARTLSIGEQQRVSLVRALLIEPEVLLLDEPTSALDEDSRAAIEELLKRKTSGGECAAIVVTHDRRQAERLADRVVNLKDHLSAGRNGGGGHA
ncbi:MAG: ATP-binding cassette domain-containing protein [Phycisphaerales bacterium]|nr:MAG: ATP-binding cassette domain-containing protein [Phycisphaerales bacterium]